MMRFRHRFLSPRALHQEMRRRSRNEALYHHMLCLLFFAACGLIAAAPFLRPRLMPGVDDPRSARSRGRGQADNRAKEQRYPCRLQGLAPPVPHGAFFTHVEDEKMKRHPRNEEMTQACFFACMRGSGFGPTDIEIDAVWKDLDETEREAWRDGADAVAKILAGSKDADT